MVGAFGDLCKLGHWLVASPCSAPLTQGKPRQEGEPETPDTLLPGILEKKTPMLPWEGIQSFPAHLGLGTKNRILSGLAGGIILLSPLPHSSKLCQFTSH